MALAVARHSTSVSLTSNLPPHLLMITDFERDPSIYVDSANCPTASSVTRIKCAFFGAPITTADATNVGQYTGDFHGKWLQIFLQHSELISPQL